MSKICILFCLVKKRSFLTSCLFWGFPVFQQEGTVVAYDKFNAEQDAEVLNKAVKGLGRE